MYTLWVLATTLVVTAADVSLGYHYKVPDTSYGVPSYQFGESASHGHTSGLSNVGSTSGFEYTTPVSSLGHHGSSSLLSQSGHSSGLNHGTVSGFGSGFGSGFNSGLSNGLSSGISSGQYYPSLSSGSGSTSSYYPSISGSTSSGQYYPSSLGSGSSTGGVIHTLPSVGGTVASLPSFGQFQNNYQNTAAYKYQQHYVQQQPAEVYKHFYVHSAPEEPEEAQPRQPIVLPPPQKHYKIIFVKTPTQQAPAPQVVAVPQQNEEKTIVYVLSKKPEEQSEVIVPKIEQKPPSKPEVYFIKYKNKEDSQSVISDIVNDYNKGDSQVSFSGISSGAHGNYDSSSQSPFGSGSLSSFGSGSQSSFGSGLQSSFGSGSQGIFGSQGAIDSGSHSIFNGGSYTVPSTTSLPQFSDSASLAPISVGGFGSNSFGFNHGASGAQSIGFGSSESSVLSSVPTVTFAPVPESSSTTASAIASGGHVSTTASSISYDNSNLISTSQGVPHETYGPPKFRV